MRTLEEIKGDVQKAVDKNDAVALQLYAAELDALGTPHAEAIANLSRGWASYVNSDYPTALEHNNRALTLSEELGTSGGVASININIGNVHHSTADYPAALEHYYRSLALNEELGNRIEVAKVTGNIGNVLGDMVITPRRSSTTAARWHYTTSLTTAGAWHSLLVTSATCSQIPATTPQRPSTTTVH